MASQIIATTGNRRLRRNQSAELNARLGYLPQMAAMKQEKEIAEKNLAFQEKQMRQNQKMREKELEFQEGAEKKQFGLEIAKLGMTGLSSGVLGDVAGMFGFGGDEPSNVAAANIGAKGGPSDPLMSVAKPGIMGTIGGMLPSALGGAALGFGASSLLGGGTKGMLAGGLAGALPGILGGIGGMFGGQGAAGFDFSKILSGGLGGILGGLGGNIFG